MSLPIISNTQGILGYTKGEPWQFQPLITLASGTLGVTSTALPTGITLSGTTGRLTCDGSTPAGLYVIGLQANDGGGNFTAVTEFTIGIEAASSLLAGSSNVGVPLDIDIVTKKVTLAGSTPEEGLPLCVVKQSDVALFNLRFFNGDVQLDPDPDTLKFAIKDLETNALLLEKNVFGAGSTGATAFYQMPVEFSSTALTNALAGEEADDGGASVICKAEIQWTQTVSIGAVSTLRITTQTFLIQIDRDYATNA